MAVKNDLKPISFSRGVPPDAAIPALELKALASAALDASPHTVFQYAKLGGYKGDELLRDQLGALHHADPEGIFIGNGSLQVLDLLAAHLLSSSMKDVFVEAPTYDRAADLFKRNGGRLVPLPMEQDGLDIAALEARLDEATPAFLYTIPDFQNPSGVTMTAEKRAAVTQLAARHGFPVVEDSPYRELRYTGAAPPRLVATSFGANVIVLTSLSKVLSPGLRIGYAVTDPATALALAQRAEQTYLSPAPLCQAIAARALEAGLLEENVARICSQLGPRRDAAVRAARESLGDSLLAIPEGGYYLSAHLAVGQDEDRFLAAARDEGVLLTRGSAFYPGPAAPPDGTLFLRLPFQTLEPQEFATGLERLSTARDSLAPV